MKIPTYSALLILLAACANPAPDPTPDPQPAAAAHAEALREARARLANGELDETLLITDRLLKQDNSDRDALLIAAQANLGLFDSGRSGGQAFLEDAIACYETATSVQPQDPTTWQQLADLYLKAGRFAKGRDAGLRAAEQLKAEGATNVAQARAVLAAADNELQIFVDTRRPELQAGQDPSPESLQLANDVLARLRWAQQGAPGEAARKAALVYRWLGKRNEELAEMERGIVADPTDGELHIAFQQTYADLGRQAECVAAYKRLMRDQTEAPILQWYLGRAQVAQADAARARSQWTAAAEGYAKAAETYGRYKAMQPQHAATTDQWLAICALSRGRVAVETGDLDAAAAAFAEAYAITPRVAETDADGRPLITDSFGGYYILGLDLIGRAIVERSTPEALAKGLAHYEKVLEQHPDRFGFIYNNAALCARDLGVAVASNTADQSVPEAEREANARRARELWEKSYAYYCKAVEYSPDDPRIVNDCGLMLLYHLHRDYDRARQLFERAVELGEAQLAALPEDASQQQRDFLEEATGDAYQNIAVLMRTQEKPFAEYEPLLKKAVGFYPHQERQAAMLLRTRGERDTRRRPQPTGAGGAPGGDAVEAAFAKVRAEAEAKAQAQDLDGALLVLDAAGKTFAEHAGFRELVGRYSLQYANRARQDGGNALQIDGLYSDAVTNLKRAVELDGAPLAPRVELTQAYYDSGDFDAASREAEASLSHVRSAGGNADAADLRRLHVLRAGAAARVYIASKQQQEDDAEALRAARTSFREIETLAAGGDEPEPATLDTQSMLEQWAGAPEQALAVYTRAAERRLAAGSTLEDLDLLQKMTDLAAKIGSSSTVIGLLAEQPGATARWFLGKAHFNAASERSLDDDRDGALRELQAAFDAFAAAKAANPEYAQSSTQWQALTLGKKGVLQLSNDADAALATLLEAARTSPDQLTQDLGGGYSIKHGLLVVADKFYRAGDLGKVVEVYRQAAAAVPSDGDFANNYGLFARDHGAELEKAGDQDAARSMYEASYAAYTRAAELEPDSIRLLNDRALLLIYHLRRDWDLATSLLREGIQKGEAQLRDDPPSDEQELRNLQESVGDCYQNLGYYQMTHGADPAAARRSFEKSLTFPPFKERASTRHLRELTDGGGDGKAGADK